jgi:transcriptional regulator with XRE-family HTH domain
MKYKIEEQGWSNQFAWHLLRLCKNRSVHMDTLFIELGLSIREKDRILAGHNPTLHKICKIAKGLKISPAKLLEFSKEKTDSFSWNEYYKEKQFSI